MKLVSIQRQVQAELRHPDGFAVLHALGSLSSGGIGLRVGIPAIRLQLGHVVEADGGRDGRRSDAPRHRRTGAEHLPGQSLLLIVQRRLPHECRS